MLLITGPGLGPEGSLEADARARGIPLQIRADRCGARFIRGATRPATARFAARSPTSGPTSSTRTAARQGSWAAWPLRGLACPAIVHTVHGAPFHPYQTAPARAFFRRCEIFAAARCHAIISVADAMTDQLVAAGVAPREKFTTIYSGMEVETFLARRRASRPRPPRARLHATTTSSSARSRGCSISKGTTTWSAAAKQACARNPQLKFLLVGDGILRPQIEAQIAAAGLTDRFQFTGLVPPRRIAELLAATDLVVHTSLREGLARVLPQALLVGRPVISYDVDGAREVVRDGETGYPRRSRATCRRSPRESSSCPSRPRSATSSPPPAANCAAHASITAR